MVSDDQNGNTCKVDNAAFWLEALGNMYVAVEDKRVVEVAGRVTALWEPHCSRIIHTIGDQLRAAEQSLGDSRYLSQDEKVNVIWTTADIMTSQIEDELKREILRDNRRGDSGRRGRSGHPGERSDGSQSMSVERGAERHGKGHGRYGPQYEVQYKYDPVKQRTFFFATMTKVEYMINQGNEYTEERFAKLARLLSRHECDQGSADCTGQLVTITFDQMIVYFKMSR